MFPGDRRIILLLAYNVLNSVRAGIVDRPEHYHWSSLGYHVQSGNRDGFLSLDFGLRAFSNESDEARLRAYRKFVCEQGSIPSDKGAKIDEAVLQAEERKNFELTAIDRFCYRTRDFTDSGVIGTKEFVSACYRRFAHHFPCRHQKKPQRIDGLDGVYWLKRLRVAPWPRRTRTSVSSSVPPLPHGRSASSAHEKQDTPGIVNPLSAPNPPNSCPRLPLSEASRWSPHPLKRPGVAKSASVGIIWLSPISLLPPPT